MHANERKSFRVQNSDLGRAEDAIFDHQSAFDPIPRHLFAFIRVHLRFNRLFQADPMAITESAMRSGKAQK